MRCMSLPNLPGLHRSLELLEQSFSSRCIELVPFIYSVQSFRVVVLNLPHFFFMLCSSDMHRLRDARTPVAGPRA